jgi:hypothetical protein
MLSLPLYLKINRGIIDDKSVVPLIVASLLAQCLALLATSA